jgi:hypothetical protein
LSEDEGGARSRLSRGLTEFVVIVASIIAAFGLDAWWGARAEAERSRAHVEAMHTEFSRTTAELTETRARLESLRMAVAAILPLVGPDAEVVPVDSISRLVDRSFRLGTVELRTGAVQALLASGELAAIGDPELKALIAGWPTDVADLRAQTRLMEENRELIIDYLHDRLPTLNVAHNTGQMDRYPRSSFSVTGERFQRDMRVEGLFSNRGMMIEDTDRIVLSLEQLASQAVRLLRNELER